MNLQKLWLLFWKYLQLRKHRWFLTICEVVLPILIVYGMCNFSQSMFPPKALPEKEVIPEVHDAAFFYRSSQLKRIYYTPETEFTRKIMKDVTGKLRHLQLNSTKDENEMEYIMSAWDSLYYLGIVFVNLPDDNMSVPDRLMYKLRRVQCRDLNTNERYAEMWSDGAPEDSAAVYSYCGFAELKLALDSSFARLVDPNSDYENVSMQAFPYPKHITDITSSYRSVVLSVVAFVVITSSLIQAVPLIIAIISEKESGVKELMKLVGLQEWLVWISWFANSLIFSVGVFTFVTILLQTEFNGPSSATIRYVDPTVLWSLITLYLLANLPFCFLFSAIFHKTTLASFLFTMAVIMISFGTFYTSTYRLNFLTCFFPAGALIQGFRRISKFELLGIPFTWSSLFWIEKTSAGVSLGSVFLMLLFDTLLYLCLTYYVTAINPGPFGTKKSPLFFLQWCCACFAPPSEGQILDFEELLSEDKFIEKPPAGLETSIRIKDLHKNFGNVYAVKGVNLNVYRGEITALLGPNGAGKTTTIAILTGLTNPTAGSIVFKDKIDVLKRMNEFRKNLGLCPQEDRLFSYLSVMNHLLFFGMLKGATREEAEFEAKNYLQLVELDDKKDSLCDSLSGGMKRKLCLLISLMGRSETLILDEPTSGLDVQSRRKIWDLLLTLRQNRTIILTTHHMEEADVLGDRIAIMRGGSIECYGTSMYLKRSYGTGYQLTITKTDNDYNQKMLTNLIIKQIPGAELIHQAATEAVYKLPVNEMARYSSLFEILEAEKNNLGIENMGIACTTMEDVFLKVGKSYFHDAIGESDRNSGNYSKVNSSYIAEKKKIGTSLILQQTSSLLFKKLLYTTRNLSHLVLRVVVPTFVGILLFLGTLDLNPGNPSLELSLSAYPNSLVMMQKTNVTPSFADVFMKYVTDYEEEIVTSNGKHVIEGLLKYSDENLLSFRNELLLAAEFNVSRLLLYNGEAKHSFGVALASYSNSHLRLLTNSTNRSVTTIIHYLPRKYLEGAEYLNQQRLVQAILWIFVLAWISIDLCDYFIIPLKVERIDGFKHIQLMSKVSPFVYWLSNIVFDFVFFLLIIVLRMLIFKQFDHFGFLDFNHQMAIMMMVFSMFALGALLYTYVVSFISRSKDVSYVLMFFINLASFMIIGAIVLVQCLQEGRPFEEFSKWVALFYFLKYLILLVPPLNFCLAFMKIVISWVSAAAEPNKPSAFFKFVSPENKFGILEEVIFLGVDTILYAGLLILIEIGDVDRLKEICSTRLFGANDTPESQTAVNANVKLEQTKVENYFTELSEFSNTILLAQHLKKQFHRIGPPLVAVHDVTFAVQPSECFGLLGVNGAGKSTTFKMLSGELAPTAGDTSILKYRLSCDRKEYLSKTGYCAQTNCFIEELTGKEMLTLIARLRGVYPEQMNDLIGKWLAILGLEIYRNQKCGTYSGGNKRKLCTAMSLIGDPNVIFLDEPTSGVDPISRRKLYDVMNQSKSSGQAVVLTSHSMEECEHLCDRLTIMVKGLMKCIGTVQQLKQQYAQGFSIQIKILDTANYENLVQSVKMAMVEKFKPKYCWLKDEHKGLLYYQITDTHVPWSESFRKMEDIKHTHNVVDDYMICDTSLEQVFMSFTKET